MNKRGRPEVAYCNTWKPKADQIRHEVLLTDFLLGYPEAEVVRGWKVNERIRPDAELILNDRKFFVEFDTGEENHTRVCERQRAYAGVSDFLLFVTLTERRMAGLINRCERVREIALFTTLERAVSDPRGEIWLDAFGNKAAI